MTGLDIDSLLELCNNRDQEFARDFDVPPALGAGLGVVSTDEVRRALLGVLRSETT